MANIYPVFLIRAEDDLIALHIALKLSEQIPTALWRPGGPEGSLNGLAVIDADDLWNAALKARNYALALVYAGEEGPADFVVRGSTGCRTYGIYRDLLKTVEKTATDIATQALEWQSGETQINVERRDGEFPSPIVVIPKGVDMKKLANKLKPYKPILHRDLAGGFIDEIMPWVKRKWPERGVVIVPNEAEVLGGLLVYVTPQDLDSVNEKIKEIISKSPCVFGEFKEPAEFNPTNGKLKPLPDEWVNRLAQGVPCNHKTLCIYAVKRWPRLAYFLRDFREPDKLAALALWNEGQLVEALKAIAAGERNIELPDYTGRVISSLLRSSAVEAQARAVMRPRKPPLVDVFGYRVVTPSLIALWILGLFTARYTYGLSFALPAIYMLIFSDVMLAWIYSMAGVGIEPRLYYLGRGVHRDVFGRTHVVYRVSPRVSALNMAAQSAYDAYRSFVTSVSLSPDDILEVRYTKDRVFLRYTGNRWNEVRGDLERHFVLFEPVALTQSPLPDRPIRIFSVVFAAVGMLGIFAAFGMYTAGILAYLFIGPILKRRARAYAAAPPMRSLTRFNLFALNIHEDPSATQGIANTISGLPEYSIIIRKDARVEMYFKSRFAKSYESVRHKGSTIFNISRYYNSFRRIDEYNERGIYVQVLTPTTISMGSMAITDPLGAFERWMFWSAKRGLSGDLTALPLFGDVKYLGRAIWIGRDRHDRDIYFFPEAMPALHALFYGRTGMGKSWTVATLLLRLKRSGYNVHFAIIDPHGDYVKLRDLLGANVVVVGKKDYIDIFSDADEKTNKLAAKLAYEELAEPMDLEQIKDYYSNLLVGKGVPINRSKDYIIAFSEKARNDPSFMYIYGSMLVHQLYRHAFDVIREGSNDVWIIVLDEAYLFLNERILRNLMLGARKFGVAVWLVVHEPGFLTDAVMSSTTLKIILGGEGVPERLRSVLKLSNEEEEWLRRARSPLELGGRAQALIIHGPSDVRYIGYVELEREVKRR